MNTTEKGNIFEDKALSIIEKIISEGQLGLMPDLIKIRRKHKYFSKIRNGYINVDLAIEVWVPGAVKHSLLYIIECKDYNTRIPALKLEAFHSQLVQLNAQKGIFISNSPLQQSAYNVANSLGIMFIQGESTDNYKIILHKTNNRSDQIPKIDENNQNDEGLSLIEKLIDHEILNAFKSEINEDFISYGIEKLSAIHIENVCNSILDQINPEINNSGQILSETQLLGYIQNELNFNVIEFHETDDKLGFCDFENFQIGLNSLLNAKNRKLFVLAHEVGHIVLHSKLKIGQNSYDQFDDSKYNFRTGKNTLNNPRHWIEWQANYFAECLLLSKNTFLFQLRGCLKLNALPIRKIYVDEQFDNINRFEKIISEMSYLFSVSKTTIIYKLKSIDMLVNNSNIKSVNQIIQENELYF